MKKKIKPNNLLFEVFALGMQAAISGTMSGQSKEIAKIAEKEMDDLAKRFGYTGLDYFDKVF
jgi:hypothetical protein